MKTNRDNITLIDDAQIENLINKFKRRLESSLEQSIELNKLLEEFNKDHKHFHYTIKRKPEDIKNRFKNKL